jgi:hypothetical protein
VTETDVGKTGPHIKTSYNMVHSSVCEESAINGTVPTRGNTVHRSNIDLGRARARPLNDD